ncbi:MAG: hypothetical protein ABSG04_08370 [Verrucomicrobiota bacterium]
MPLTAAVESCVVADNVNALTTFEGGPEGEPLAVLTRFSDDSKSLTLKEATAGSGMSGRSARNALKVLLEYQSPLLTAMPRQNRQVGSDDAAYRITPLGKEYLAWKERQGAVPVFPVH